MRKNKNKTKQLSFLNLGGTSVLTKAKKAGKIITQSNTDDLDSLFDNLINLETVSEILGVAPKTIHNWVYLHRIPYIKVGRKVMFRQESLKKWLNRKEIKSWL